MHVWYVMESTNKELKLTKALFTKSLTPEQLSISQVLKDEEEETDHSPDLVPIEDLDDNKFNELLTK